MTLFFYYFLLTFTRIHVLILPNEVNEFYFYFFEKGQTKVKYKRKETCKMSEEIAVTVLKELREFRAENEKRMDFS